MQYTFYKISTYTKHTLSQCLFSIHIYMHKNTLSQCHFSYTRYTLTQIALHVNLHKTPDFHSFLKHTKNGPALLFFLFSPYTSQNHTDQLCSFSCLVRIPCIPEKKYGLNLHYLQFSPYKIHPMFYLAFGSISRPLNSPKPRLVVALSFV